MSGLIGLSFAGGLAMGLASSLHCLGMCGGIVSALSLSLNPEYGRRARVAFGLQGGRIGAYTAMGALAGGFGGAGLAMAGVGSWSHAAAFGLMRTLAALGLGWAGLALTGLAPGLGLLDRLFLATGSRLQRLKRSLPPGLGAPLAGLAWGFMPCGMVYGALLLAMASGSTAGGIRVMAGFGLGTAPAMLSAAYGTATMQRIARRKAMRVAMGCAIIALAAGSVLMPAATVRSLCLG